MHQGIVIMLVVFVYSGEASPPLPPAPYSEAWPPLPGFDSHAQSSPPSSYRTVFLLGFCVVIFPLLYVSIYVYIYNHMHRQQLSTLIAAQLPIASINIAQESTRRRPLHDSTQRGLDTALVIRLPTLQFSAKGDQDHDEKAGVLSKDCSCPVCLGEFREGETLKILPTCLHRFHVECIDMWLFSHVTCPLCRSSLVQREGGFNTLQRDNSHPVDDPPGAPQATMHFTRTIRHVSTRGGPSQIMTTSGASRGEASHT